MLVELIHTLGIDQTLWIQLAVFVVFFLWLRFVFFTPFLSLLEKRHAKTLGLRQQTEELLATAGNKETELAARLAEVKRQAQAEQEKKLGEAKSLAHEQIDKAKKEAKKHIEEARARAESELTTDLAAVNQRAHELSELLVAKLSKERRV